MAGNERDSKPERGNGFLKTALALGALAVGIEVGAHLFHGMQ
jgi:hypothetical protein